MLLCFREKFFPEEKLPVDTAVVELTIFFQIEFGLFRSEDKVILNAISLLTIAIGPTSLKCLLNIYFCPSLPLVIVAILSLGILPWGKTFCWYNGCWIDHLFPNWILVIPQQRSNCRRNTLSLQLQLVLHHWSTYWISISVALSSLLMLLCFRGELFLLIQRLRNWPSFSEFNSGCSGAEIQLSWKRSAPVISIGIRIIPERRSNCHKNALSLCNSVLQQMMMYFFF